MMRKSSLTSEKTIWIAVTAIFAAAVITAALFAIISRWDGVV